MTLKAILATAAILATSYPASAAMAQSPSGTTEQACADFGWLLGAWDAYSPWGDQSKPANGTLVFTLAADGSVEGRIGQAGHFTAEGYTDGMLVYRGFRTVRSYGADGVTRFQSFDGQFYYHDRGRWEDHSIGVRQTGELYMLPTAISRLGGGGPFRKRGSQAPAGRCGTDSDRQSDPATAPRPPAPAAPAAPASDRPLPEAAENKRPRCDQITYVGLLNPQTGKVIADFTAATESIAVFDPSLPGARLYPSPITSSANIPSFLTAEQYLVFDAIETEVAALVTNRGADDWLKSTRNRLLQLHRQASDRYEAAGTKADDAFEPCPLYSEPSPFALLVEAEAAVAALRARRDTRIKPMLARAGVLNEALLRRFYGELDDTRSLDSKAKTWAKERFAEAFASEAVAPQKIEALIPQLDSLQALYRRLESEGTPVSDAQRDADLAAALEKAGIAYDPKRDVDPQGSTAGKISRKLYDYTRNYIVGPGPQDLFAYYSKVAGYVGLAKDTAEIVNALKNLYDLWGVGRELMPTTLAVTEGRAYLAGLVARYDRVEAEYLAMRTDFEKAVTDSGRRGVRSD